MISIYVYVATVLFLAALVLLLMWNNIRILEDRDRYRRRIDSLFN